MLVSASCTKHKKYVAWICNNASIEIARVQNFALLNWNKASRVEQNMITFAATFLGRYLGEEEASEQESDW